MKKIVFLIVLIVGCLIFNDGLAADNGKIKGVWDYKVPSAPYEYSVGQLIISDHDGNLDLTIKLMDGTEIKGEKVNFGKGKLSFGVYIDYDFVSLELNLQDNKLTGVAQGPEGPLDFSAEKKK